MSRDGIFASVVGVSIAIGLFATAIFITQSGNQPYLALALSASGIVLLVGLIIYDRREIRRRSCIFNYAQESPTQGSDPLLVTIGEGSVLSPESQQKAAHLIVEKAKTNPDMPSVPASTQVKFTCIHDLPLCYERDKIIQLIHSLQPSLQFTLNKAVFSEYKQDQYRFLVAYINMPDSVEKYGTRVKSPP